MFSKLDIFWHKILRRPYRLKYKMTGEGKPLVLLHGLGASRKKWDPLLKIIDPKQWTVIVPDLLGFGRSPKPGWSDYTVSEHARNVKALIERKKLPLPLTVAGHSMGCLVATHLAATSPGTVERLVLYQPPLFAQLPDFPRHSNRTRKHFAFFEYVASRPQLAFLQSKLLRRIYGKIKLLNLSDKEWLPFAKSLKNTIMNQRAYDELRKIEIPTDIIHGRLDFIVTKTEIKEMFAHNPNIKLHKVTEMHDVTPRSARYILKLLESKKNKSKESTVVS